jgi:signal transduction histidine kinase
MARRTLLITYIATYLLVIGEIIRYVIRFRDYRPWSIALLLGYLILFFSEPFYVYRKRLLTIIYLLIQTAIICTLSLITPDVDFWTVLFFPLILLVMRNFPQRTGYLITGIFSVVMAFLLLLGPGFKAGLPLIYINTVSYFLISAFIAIIHEAETTNEELRKQQLELQTAHEQLQTYTRQAEELAILRERNRLARELHDSVTQSLHSSTLLAEAGQRLVSSGNLERARGYLIRLSEISQQALKEMRLLVYELRPLAISGVGFEGALQHRLDAIERRSGVVVNLSITVDHELPTGIEEELYRIAMEALNNALKHANSSTISVTLRQVEKRGTPCIELVIIDDGVGFDPDMKQDEGGMGLVTMKERIEKLEGELTILSALGEGTQVKACVNLSTSPNFTNPQEE